MEKCCRDEDPYGSADYRDINEAQDAVLGQLGCKEVSILYITIR